ncbi:DUF5990 family protein [Flavobacterium sp. RHBU_24]|uniref:DUF5990 family protein n=1 Tax=Flavobacterium sp. RHBU_24 TaxID=3391185 RepID=UPI0039847F1D
MQTALPLRITLTNPSAGVDFGVQNGSGHTYTITGKQRSTGADLSFAFEITVKGDPAKDALPKLSGPYVQGPSGGKFTYINIGPYAGQHDGIWSGRMKIPLTGITWDMVDKLAANPNLTLATTVPGSKPDGSPAYATVKPFEGWKIL